MAESWLSFINLSDHYERKARFLPAVISILPLLPVSIAYGGPLGNWIKILLSGVGISAVVAVAISYLASAFGNHLQKKLWPNWPNDAPTNTWLYPEYRKTSLQQKKLWYQEIKKLISLDIESVINQHNPKETEVIINDAVKVLRSLFWNAPEADLLRIHNIDYAFARNLTGLRIVWILFATASSLGCWAGYFWNGHPIIWSVISTTIAVFAIPIALCLLPGYVRKRADYYAESFFGVLFKKAGQSTIPDQGLSSSQGSAPQSTL
jgi:hypothetical protein